MADLKTEVEQNIARYAGAVLINRALCDSRDMLKPSTRMLIYSQLETSKNLPTKPYMKCARIVGDALGHWYSHGDASCYSIYARLAKPFAMRYVLEDFHGNYGTLKETGNEAASRYTEIRLSELGASLFADIEKDTISDWEFNFDETEKYPRVATSKGFYNIVNGGLGIGYGAASSIPQFNLREVNEALIKLLWNPDIDPREIICLPDFSTGAQLLNRDEVIESLLNGTGRACKLRSTVEYDKNRRAFKITEIPYGVYTDTIRKQVKDLLDKNEGLGIEGYNDMSARNADIEIYLSKNANPDKILKLLYKETALESYYGINMTMLEDGRFPKVFTWKEALQSYLSHQVKVYTQGFTFDLHKIKSRLHIVNGLIKAVSILDEVIALIRSAADSKVALIGLQQTFEFTEAQAKAILDIKLARLTHLDINKLETEQKQLETDKQRLEEILNNEDKLKAEIEKDLRSVMAKYGDARRTKILNLSTDNEEVIEQKQLSLSFTNHNAVYVTETNSLYTQKRNGVGTKFKLEKDEYIMDNVIGDNTDTILFFTSKGNFYHMRMSEFAIGEKQYLSSLFNFLPGEYVRATVILNHESKDKNLIFVTKFGIIKKSSVEEYNLKRQVGASALTLDDGDEIVAVLVVKDDTVGILSQMGNFIWIETKDIRAIGRTARGVQGIKLNPGDSVSAAHEIPAGTTEILSVTSTGLSKRTSINEFHITGRATKGTKIQKGEELCDFLPITDKSDILISSTKSQIRIALSDISLLSKGAQGTLAIKLPSADVKVMALSKF